MFGGMFIKDPPHEEEKLDLVSASTKETDIHSKQKRVIAKGYKLHPEWGVLQGQDGWCCNRCISIQDDTRTYNCHLNLSCLEPGCHLKRKDPPARECSCEEHGVWGKILCPPHYRLSFPHGRPCGMCGFDMSFTPEDQPARERECPKCESKLRLVRTLELAETLKKVAIWGVIILIFVLLGWVVY